MAYICLQTPDSKKMQWPEEKNMKLDSSRFQIHMPNAAPNAASLFFV